MIVVKKSQDIGEFKKSIENWSDIVDQILGGNRILIVKSNGGPDSFEVYRMSLAKILGEKPVFDYVSSHPNLKGAYNIALVESAPSLEVQGYYIMTTSNILHRRDVFLIVRQTTMHLEYAIDYMAGFGYVPKFDMKLYVNGGGQGYIGLLMNGLVHAWFAPKAERSVELVLHSPANHSLDLKNV